MVLEGGFWWGVTRMHGFGGRKIGGGFYGVESRNDRVAWAGKFGWRTAKHHGRSLRPSSDYSREAEYQGVFEVA